MAKLTIDVEGLELTCTRCGTKAQREPLRIEIGQYVGRTPDRLHVVSWRNPPDWEEVHALGAQATLCPLCAGVAGVILRRVVVGADPLD